MNIKTLSLLSVTALSVLTVSLSPIVAHAEGASGAAPTAEAGEAPDAPVSTIDSPTGVINALQSITNWMFTIFIALAAMMIIYAAFIYLTSGGGEEVSKAHKMMLYAAVAIAVATMSRGIVRLVENFTKQP